jgi:hypothetical protein
MNVSIPLYVYQVQNSPASSFSLSLAFTVFYVQTPNSSASPHKVFVCFSHNRTGLPSLINLYAYSISQIVLKK